MSLYHAVKAIEDRELRRAEHEFNKSFRQGVMTHDFIAHAALLRNKALPVFMFEWFAGADKLKVSESERTWLAHRTRTIADFERFYEAGGIPE